MRPIEALQQFLSKLSEQYKNTLLDLLAAGTQPVMIQQLHEQLVAIEKQIPSVQDQKSCVNIFDTLVNISAVIRESVVGLQNHSSTSAEQKQLFVQKLLAMQQINNYFQELHQITKEKTEFADSEKVQVKEIFERLGKQLPFNQDNKLAEELYRAAVHRDLTRAPDLNGKTYKEFYYSHAVNFLLPLQQKLQEVKNLPASLSRNTAMGRKLSALVLHAAGKGLELGLKQLFNNLSSTDAVVMRHFSLYEYDWTPLHAAAHYASAKVVLDIIECLLGPLTKDERAAKIMKRDYNEDSTPIQFATKMNDQASLKYFFAQLTPQQCQDQIKRPDKEGRTTIHYAACITINTIVLSSLLTQLSLPECAQLIMLEDRFGYTPVHIAADNRNLGALALFFQYLNASQLAEFFRDENIVKQFKPIELLQALPADMLRESMREQNILGQAIGAIDEFKQAYDEMVSKPLFAAHAARPLVDTLLVRNKRDKTDRDEAAQPEASSAASSTACAESSAKRSAPMNQ